LDRLHACENPFFRRETSNRRRESILAVLFVARLATSVGGEILDAFGQEFLFRLVSQFQRQRTWLADDLDPFQSSVEAYIRENQAPSETIDAIWWAESERYWSWFSENAIGAGFELTSLLHEQDYKELPEETVSRLVSDFGGYPVQAGIEFIDNLREFAMPDGFAQVVLNGLELKSNPELSDVEIDHYANGIVRHGFEHHLHWMVPWLRASVRYRSEDYEAAFAYIETAFECAKYCAGNKQYQLVNQYIELAAKTDRWICFKKGVEWAQYLGLSVRWLRDREPSMDNLKDTFEMMKRVQYGTL